MGWLGRMQFQGASGSPESAAARSAAWRSLAAALLALPLSACAYDTVGTLASRVTSAEGAWVVDVYSLGAYLHPRADDPGLQVGIGRRSYVFDKRAADDLTPGWHYFIASLPERAAIARDTRSLGIETSFARNDIGATLGLYGQTMIAQAGADESRFYRLSYTPARPAETSLQIFTDIVTGGETACATCR